MTECIFCKIAAHTIAVDSLYEDEQCLAFADMAPKAPTHLLFIPKQHFANIASAPGPTLGHLLRTAATFAESKLPQGFRIVVNTGNDGGQTVHHLHLHVLGGRAMSWPPG